MIITLYGPDTYRCRQKLKEIIEQHKKIRKSGLNLRYFDGASDDLEEILNWLKLAPMFQERKLAVLENALKFSGHFKNFAKSEDIVLLFFEEGDVAPKKLPTGKAQRFDFLQGNELKRWIKAEFEKLGAKPSPEAVEKLIDFVGSDSWHLANEIKKLASFRKNAKVEAVAETSSHLPPRPALQVSAKDVELLVRPKIETDIFKTIDALASKNKKLALTLLKNHLIKGDHPLYLLTMINYQFRNLLLVKSGGSRKLALRPFVLRKLATLSQKFTLEELKKIYRKIFETDLNIKTGKMEPQAALELLISEV